MADDLLARLQAAQSDAEREWIVLDNLLQGLPQGIQTAVWAAAIPHWIDKLFLYSLLNETEQAEFEAGGGFETFIGLSFVETFEGRGFNIHERSRNLLLNQLWQNERDRYRFLSQQAFEYCQTQELDDPKWRIEWIYHLIIFNPDEGTDALKGWGWEWQNPPNFAFHLVEAMSQTTREHLEANRLEPRGRGWTLFWEAHVDKIFNRYREAKRTLQQIEFSSFKDDSLKANTLKALGDVHEMLDEYEAAREKYEVALLTYQAIGARLGEANTLQALGFQFRKMDDDVKARSYFEDSILIYRSIGAELGEVNSFLGLGDIDRKEGKWDTAGAKYRKAQDYYKKVGMQFNIALAYQRRGYAAKGKNDILKAKELFQKAYAIYQQIGVSTQSIEEDLASLDEEE